MTYPGIQSAALLSEQALFARRGDLLPLRRLMMAVLRDAIWCFQGHLLDPSRRGRRLYREAEAWLMEDGDDGPLCFESACAVLGLEPDFIRGRLRRWRDRETPVRRELVKGTSPW